MEAEVLKALHNGTHFRWMCHRVVWYVLFTI